MKKIISVFLVSCSSLIFAQSPSDCLFAIEICDSVYQEINLNDDPNNIPNEINTSFSCLGVGETRGRWYRFKSIGAGTLSFTILPADTTYDLDWSLFNLTQNNCSDIWSDPSLEIACNFNGISDNNGSTGANGWPGGQNTNTISIDSSSQFYLFISTFNLDANDSLGYVIDFSASTIEFIECEALQLNDMKDNNYTHIYPNPTNDFLYFTPPHGSYSINVYDSRGRKMETNTALDSAINVSSYPNGIYILTIQTESGFDSKKWIKK